MNLNETPLIPPEWLLSHIDDPNLVIMDASMIKTVSGSAPIDNNSFLQGSRLFDFENTICDLSSELPHTMPTPECFTSEIQKLGVSRNSAVVVYDNKGIYSSPRAWWMFKTMGHDNVAVLDGGLPTWQTLGYPVEKSLNHTTASGNFESHFRPDTVFSAADVLQAINDDTIQLIDVRSPSRYSGTVPEPRQGLRSGHIPSAINMPFASVIRNDRIIPVAELTRLFDQVLNSKSQKLVFHCGSGVTSCILILAAFLCGYRNLAVYDGSWAEWGARKDLPVSTL